MYVSEVRSYKHGDSCSLVGHWVSCGVMSNWWADINTDMYFIYLCGSTELSAFAAARLWSETKFGGIVWNHTSAQFYISIAHALSVSWRMHSVFCCNMYNVVWRWRWSVRTWNNLVDIFLLICRWWFSFVVVNRLIGSWWNKVLKSVREELQVLVFEILSAKLCMVLFISTQAQP